jgi:hypothetical protein
MLNFNTREGAPRSRVGPLRFFNARPPSNVSCIP